MHYWPLADLGNNPPGVSSASCHSLCLASCTFPKRPYILQYRDNTHRDNIKRSCQSLHNLPLKSLFIIKKENLQQIKSLSYYFLKLHHTKHKYYREGPVEVLKTFRNPQETQLNSLIFFVNMSCYIRRFGWTETLWNYVWRNNPRSKVQDR